jgi:hypothetical protein
LQAPLKLLPPYPMYGAVNIGGTRDGVRKTERLFEKLNIYKLVFSVFKLCRNCLLLRLS